MDRRVVFGLAGILLCLGVPIAWAVLSPTFSNTVWQVPTMKADNYYVGAGSIMANSTGLYGAEIYRGGSSLTTLLAAASEDARELDPTPGDHAGSGPYAAMTVGESVTFGQALYMKSDGKLWMADANATTTMPVVALALGTITANNSGDVQKLGFIRDDTWTWTIGGMIYASGTTGALTQTAPNSSGDIVQVVGYAVTADVMYFNPSYVTVEIS